MGVDDDGYSFSERLRDALAALRQPRHLGVVALSLAIAVVGYETVRSPVAKPAVYFVWSFVFITLLQKWALEHRGRR